MIAVREDVWDISSTANPWPPTLLAYASAVRAMQAKPINDPTSWLYQAAIHGRSDSATDRVPWNSCQHSTWYFLPWHRMYLYQFERIVRGHVVADGGPDDWALPYWDYSSTDTRRSLPPAFRQELMPDGTSNPLWVPERSAAINSGTPLDQRVSDATPSLELPSFTARGVARPGFGGSRTVAVHFGSGPGALENQPHNLVHVEIGGDGGLMTDPDLAALDPIFWLHHCNIDRLWETWLAQGNSNELGQRFTAQTFQLHDPELEDLVCMSVEDVLNTEQLGYTYPNLPAIAAVAPAGTPEDAMEREPTVAMIGRADTELTVDPQGGRVEVALGQLPPQRPAAADSAGPRFHVQLADVTGERNPGVVFGVYVNLPEGATEAERAARRVGMVSFFGIEHTTGRGEQPLQYTFDITEVVAALREEDDPTQVTVTLLPVREPEETAAGGAAAGGAAADVRPSVHVGTVAVLTTGV